MVFKIDVMITSEQLKQLEGLLNEVSSDKHYWFFRSMGGAFYDEFISSGFIAMGYDEIKNQQLSDLPERDNMARESLKAHIKKFNIDYTDSQIAKAAGQIIKFYRNMKVGDIVVVPNYQSKVYAIGKVQSELYEDSIFHSGGQCKFLKRRKVKWLREVRRYEFDPKFLLALTNQQTMSSVDEYAEFIDRKINNLYTKGDKTYLVLRVNQDKGLSWDDFCFIADLGELFKEVSKTNGINVDLTQIEMKINVQSPGDILLSCLAENGFLLFGAAVVLYCLTVGCDIGAWGIKVKTGGLGDFVKKMVEAYTLYKDHELERALRLENRVKNMQIERLQHINNEESSEDETIALPSSPQESSDDTPHS